MAMTAAVLAVVVLVWYFFGYQLNRRRAIEVARIVREHLPVMGENPKLRWYGVSGFFVTVEEPAEPFRDISLTVLLEPREVALLWLWRRLIGHVDRMMLRVEYRRPPQVSEEHRGEYEGLTGIELLKLGPARPHLMLAVWIPRGAEGSIGRAIHLARDLGA